MFHPSKDGNVAQELHQNDAVLVLRYLFERRLANFDFFSKLRTVVYPPNKARIGVKLWQNAFQTICNFSFFDAEKNFGPQNFQKNFQRRKIKICKSSEMRVAEVSRRSERRERGKRTFEVRRRLGGA